MTSWTPVRPRARSERENAVQNAPSSLSRDVEAQDLAVPVRRDSGRDHDGLGDDPVIDPGMAIGRVQEHVRERLPGQRAVPEHRDFGVEVGADPADFGLGDPAVGTEGPHQVVHLAGGSACR
jgi:hypothetical protein